MNNKDFIAAIAQRTTFNVKKTQKLVDAFAENIADSLDDDTSLNIPGFGTFEVKKRMERITVNPSSKQRKLIPPRLALVFKTSAALKDRVN